MRKHRTIGCNVISEGCFCRGFKTPISLSNGPHIFGNLWNIRPVIRPLPRLENGWNRSILFFRWCFKVGVWSMISGSFLQNVDIVEICFILDRFHVGGIGCLAVIMHVRMPTKDNRIVATAGRIPARDGAGSWRTALQNLGIEQCSGFFAEWAYQPRHNFPLKPPKNAEVNTLL